MLNEDIRIELWLKTNYDPGKKSEYEI